MQPLASAIQKRVDALVDQYDARLCTMPGYNRLPEAMRRELERHVLNLIAQCLETADHSALVQYVQQRASQWEAMGLDVTWFQQALQVPEEILVPLIDSVEAGNFLWQALNRSQNAVWQMVAARAQQTEERFRSIVETSHSGILITDDAFHLIYVNDELVRISGYSREELLNTDFRRLFDEDSRRIVIDHYVRRQRGEDVPPRYEVMFLHKDGAKRYIEMSAVALKDVDGKMRTVAQILDITEQKQAETALGQERNLLRTLIDSLPDRVFFKDVQGRVILNNLADAHALRVGSPEEAVGKSDFDFYPPELAARYHADDMAVIESGQPLFNREEPSLDEHERQRWLLTTKVPLTDNEGRRMGLVGISRDITERRSVETALRENEAKLRAIYEGSNDAIMLLNPQGFFDCNTQTLKLFGFQTKEEFTAVHPADVSPPFQPDGQDSLATAQERIQTAYRQGYNRFDWVHRRTNGEDFPAEVLLSAFEYGGEQVLQATVRDITERKRAEATLQQTVAQQQRQSRRLRAALEATDELIRITDLDLLYRRAVELAREKLDIERCGMWLIDPTRQYLLGTYGTDLEGRTVDERTAKEPIEAHSPVNLFTDKLWFAYDTLRAYWKDGKEVEAGSGWVVGTSLRSAKGPIGIFYNDAAISGTPLDEELQNQFALYGSMVGNIIENKRLEQQVYDTLTKERVASERLRGVVNTGYELMQTPDLDTLYRQTVELAHTKLGVERCGLYILDEAGEYLVGTYGTDEQGNTIDQRSEANRMPTTKDLEHDLLFAPRERLWTTFYKERTLWRDGQVYGLEQGWNAATVLRGSTGPRGVLYNDAAISNAPYDETLQETIALYCTMVGNIIENKRLDQSIRELLVRRDAQVQTSIEVAQHIAAAPELDELFHRVVTLIKERFNYYHAQLFRYEPAEDAVVLISGYGEIGQKMLTAGHKLAMGRGVVGTAAATGQSILAADVARDLDWRPNPNLPNTRGELAVPIKLGGGDAESQINALNHFVNGSYDGIAITAIDPVAVARITHEVLPRGKPIVAVSTDLGQDNQTALVFAIEHEMGYLLGVQAGNWAKQHVPGDQNVQLAMLNYRTLSQVIQREMGILDGIKSVIGERVTVVASGSAAEAKAAAYLTEGWLREHPHLNMIVAYNDATALGAYQVAQAMGRHDPDRFFIGGIDAVPEALAAIQQGGVYQATVNQPPEIMGIMAVRTLVAAIKGIPVTPVHALYCAPVNRSNVAEFSGPSREAALFAHQDIIPAEVLSGLDVSGLRLGLSVLTLANPFFAVLAESAQKEAQRLGVQLVVNDPSRILGVLDVQSDQANALTDDDRLLLEGLCGQIATAIESTHLLEELRRGEAQLSEALKIAKLAYWEYDVANDRFLFNDQFYSLFHTTAEQAGGYQLSSAQYAQQFVHPDDLPLVGTEIEKALKSTDRHYTRLLEHRILYADGGVGYISVNVNIDRDEQGHILRYYGANQDITERKLAEEVLRRGEAQLSEALKIAKLAYWEYDVEKDQFVFNDQFYSLFHTTAEKAGGYQLSSAQYAQQFVHPDDLPLVGTEIEKALKSTDRHYTRLLEHRILYADGGVGYISVNVNIDRDEEGHILRYYGANQDITNSKLAEQAIREEQQRTRTILETITIPMIISRLSDSKVLYANQALAQFRRMDLDQLIGSRTIDYFVDPNDRDRLVEILRRQGYATDFETQLRGSGEVPSWVLLSARIINFQNETCVLSTYVDITERKRTEAESERLFAGQQQRAVQLQTASEVSRAASSSLNVEELLPQAAELIRARFNFYYVGIFLTDEMEHWAVLRAGTGSAGRQMLDNGHKLKIGGSSMISQCILRKQAQIALDVGEAAVRFDNPLLPLTHSEIALPLISRGRVIGGVTIQSEQEAAFTTEDVTILQSMADQIANAVENANLYAQAQAALQEVDAINRRLTGEAWEAYLRSQAGRQVLRATDDDTAAPEALSSVDDRLSEGEVMVEPASDEAEATVTAPILLRGQPIGALRLRTPRNEWNEDTQAILTDIANHIAQAAENARLIEQTQSTAQRERMINEINARVRQSIDLNAILKTAVSELGQSLKAARVVARVGTVTAEGTISAAGDGRGETND